MIEASSERRAKRWTREEVYRLVELGAFPEKAPYELLDGELIEKMPEKSPHANATDTVYDWLFAISKPGYFVRNQHPIFIDESNEPEPDVAVVAGERRDYVDHPRPTDVALLVEVCDSTFRDDRRRKVPLYALSAIPEVWLLDLSGRRLLVHCTPNGEEYDVVRTVHEDESVAPLFRPGASVLVRDLLP